MVPIFDFSMPVKNRRYRVKYNGVFVNALDGTILEFNFASDAISYVVRTSERMGTARSCFEVVPVILESMK